MAKLDTSSGQQRSAWPRRITFGVFAVGISMLIAWLNLQQGWFPHDEGQLGQAGERVLQGELPHRDFDEMYTGGLSFLNAFSFYLWGVSSHSMRWMLFAWFVPFVIAVYWLASEFAKPWVAGLVTLLAAAWSIPMYSAPMPSWYNLFFATWMLCAMVAFYKTDQRRYLILAGLLIGLSILMKISGVFMLAAVLLALLYRNQEQFRMQPESSLSFSVVVTLGLIFASLLSLSFVTRHDWMAQIVHLVIPFVGLTGFAIYNEWTSARGSFAPRFVAASAEVMTLGIGVAIPVLGIAAVYFQQDAIQHMFYGAMVMPTQRLEFAFAPFPPLHNFVFALPLAALIFPAISGLGVGKQHERGIVFVTLVIVVFAFFTQSTPAGFTMAFQSFRNLAPVLAIGNLILMLRLRDRWTRTQRQQLYLFTAVAFFVSSIQFPFAAPIYFFYAAPLLLLAALFATQLQPCVPRKSLAIVAVFLLLLSCTRFHSHNAGRCLSAEYQDLPASVLQAERGRLRVRAEDAQVFNRLNSLIERHTAESETILATPDAPAVCFMTQRRALNGVMYEFFRNGIYDDLVSLKKELDDKHVNIVVINEEPAFSSKVSPEFRKVVLAEFQLLESIEIERNGQTMPTFTVYKRRSTDGP